MADHVMTWGEPEPAWDQQVEVMELPRIFRTTIDSIPASVPYFHLPTNVSPRLPESDALGIGVVWAASCYNPARWIPIETLASLFDLPGTRFYSLQMSPASRQLAPWSAKVTNLQGETSCVLETAIRVQELDLVITVDTMMAHLAGALGKQVWTVLPFRSDWRWMTGRRDSPWYPTMRLFRQPEPGDWNSVIDEIKSELKSMAPFDLIRSGSGQQKIEG